MIIVSLLVLLFTGAIMSIFSKKIIYLWTNLIFMAPVSVFELTKYLLVSIGVELPYRLFIELLLSGIALYIVCKIIGKIDNKKLDEENSEK